MTTHEPLTTGQIAKRHGCPRHQIDYIIESRAIEPCCRLGIVRLFDAAAQRRIEDALQEIESRRPRAVSV